MLAHIFLCHLLPPPGSVRVNHILSLAESLQLESIWIIQMQQSSRYPKMSSEDCERVWIRVLSLLPVVHLYLRISPEFSKKFETVLRGYSGARGKLIHEKNQKQKISWHCPFNPRLKCILLAQTIDLNICSYRNCHCHLFALLLIHLCTCKELFSSKSVFEILWKVKIWCTNNCINYIFTKGFIQYCP